MADRVLAPLAGLIAVREIDSHMRLGMLGAVAPDRLALKKLIAEHGALALHALGQERVGIAEAGDALQERALGWR